MSIVPFPKRTEKLVVVVGKVNSHWIMSPSTEPWISVTVLKGKVTNKFKWAKVRCRKGLMKCIWWEKQFPIWLHQLTDNYVQSWTSVSTKPPTVYSNFSIQLKFNLTAEPNIYFLSVWRVKSSPCWLEWSRRPCRFFPPCWKRTCHCRKSFGHRWNLWWNPEERDGMRSPPDAEDSDKLFLFACSSCFCVQLKVLNGYTKMFYFFLSVYLEINAHFTLFHVLCASEC